MNDAHTIVNRIAGGNIAAFTAVKKGADDNTVVAAAAATDKIIGITVGPVGMTSVATDRVDIVTGGMSEGLAGGTVTVGDALTSDASGRLIATTTTANRIIAFAMKDAVVGDIFQININPGVY